MSTTKRHNLNVLSCRPFLDNSEDHLEEQTVFKAKARPSKSLGFLGVSYSQTLDYETKCKKEVEFDSYRSTIKHKSDDVKRKRAISLIEQRSSYRLSGNPTLLESPSVVQAVLATRPGKKYQIFHISIYWTEFTALYPKHFY